jgi:hypothetical protein
VEREKRIGGTETGNEVVLEGSNSTLGAVTTVNAWGGKLEGDVGVV